MSWREERYVEWSCDHCGALAQTGDDLPEGWVEQYDQHYCPGCAA